MTILTPWLEITIPGSIYFITSILIILSIAGKRDFSFISKVTESSYLFPLSIILIFISYVIGLSAYVITEQILSWLYPSTKYLPKELLEIKNFSKDVYESLTYTYSNLVMFRHLVISTFVLSFSFFFWSRNTLLSRRKRWTISLSGLFFSLIFLWAYCSQREFLIVLKKTLTQL